MATNLVTLNEYKDYAGISTSEQDTKIKNVITYTSDFIKEYCSRTFIDNFSNGTATSIVEVWSGGVDYYYPKEFPVLSITKVEYSSDWGTTYTTLTAGVDFAHDLERDRLYIPGAAAIEGINAYKITYTGGYSTTPASLKAAALDLVSYYMKHEASPRKTAGSVSIEYIRSSDLPPHIKRVLDLYRVMD